MNRIIATIILLGAAPVIAILAIGVRLTSGGPAIYKQRRLGLGGREFVIYKLRTLGPISKFGKFLRRTSLDELPQLWNVLRGEMNLVGPRPERPHLAASLAWIPGYRERLSVKPGMTGLAQINGWRGDTSIIERVKCDLDYIARQSLWLDVRILALTSIRSRQTGEAVAGSIRPIPGFRRTQPASR